MTIPTTIVAGLVADALNRLWCEPCDDKDSGCCANCCVPCSSLEWFADHMPDDMSVVVRLVVGDGWDWQRDDGTIDWDAVKGKWRGCSNCTMDRTDD